MTARRITSTEAAIIKAAYAWMRRYNNPDLLNDGREVPLKGNLNIAVLADRKAKWGKK